MPSNSEKKKELKSCYTSLPALVYLLTYSLVTTTWVSL